MSEGKNNPWRRGNGYDQFSVKNYVFLLITTCAIEATIWFDSRGQVDEKQVFRPALF
jgi:hypothetical protein